MTEKRTEGDGWKISSRQCGIRYRRFGREARQKIRCLPGQKQRKRIRRSRIRIRDREQKEGRQNRKSRELRKIKRMELKKMKLKKMEWKSRSRSRRKQESQNRQPESASTAEPEAPQSVPEETIETGGAPREILYPEADTIQETISPDLLADPQALLNRFFVVDPNTSVLPGEIDGSTLLGKDLTLPENAEGPQILIYHTHSQETFADSRPGERADTVIGLGDDLQELLEKQYGYEVLHITEAFDMKEGCLERSRAYNYAEPVIAAALEEHPSIQVVIDLHRDGVNGSKRLVTEINGKPTAQIMFFNGLSRTKESGELTSLPNPYQAENLAFSFQMEYEAKQYYPGFSRCIYLKGYRYNLHLRPRSVLLEVGAQTNTVEEVKNAMGPFADILHKVLSGKSPASGG